MKDSVWGWGVKKLGLNDGTDSVSDAGVACRRVAGGLAACRPSLRKMRHVVECD